MRSPSRAGALAGLLVALAASGLTGCGHPATQAECDELFAKNAEIELRGQRVSDPAELAKRTAKAREDEGEAFMKRCLGRRITRRALECIRGASTAEQVDRCL